MTAHEKPERGEHEATSDGAMPSTHRKLAILLQLAWDEIERLQKERDALQAELALVRLELAHVRPGTRPLP